MGTYSNHLIMMSVEQAVVMIYRLFGSTKATDADILDRYQDGNKVSPWERDAVAFAISNKLMEPDNAIQPQTPIRLG